MNGDLLIIDDNERIFKSLAMNFRRSGFSCRWAENRNSALTAAHDHDLCAAVIDLSLGSESGLDVMQSLLEIRPTLPVVFISGFGTLEAAVSAMKMGAFDFLPKPLNFNRLLEVVKNAITAKENDSQETTRSTRHIIRPLPDELDSNTKDNVAGPVIISLSNDMASLKAKAAKVAESDLPVLITGESGTGKELLAEYVHTHSPRSGRPFVRINCSSITDTLADSEFFGHVKGSFTGATTDHQGFFEQADGGTLHLDEIGDMPMSAQAKILRTLETSLVRAIGGIREKRIDVRIIASTNKRLEELIPLGQFRDDLFYRINAVQLDIPPLRQRREDIQPLLEHFLHELPGGERNKHFSNEAVVALNNYSWPGNARELRNIVKVCALLAPGDAIRAEDLPQSVKTPTQDASISGRINEVEKHTIQGVLSEVKGNRRLAAERLGISVRTLYYKLDRYGLS